MPEEFRYVVKSDDDHAEVTEKEATKITKYNFEYEGVALRDDSSVKLAGKR